MPQVLEFSDGRIAFLLDDADPAFPDPRLIPEEVRPKAGYFAIGGDLSPERLLNAYRVGIFPWTDFRMLKVPEGEETQWWNRLRWYCPLTRFVIFPEEVHVSHSMRTLLNKGRYRMSIDENFEATIRACSTAFDHDFQQPRNELLGAWLGEDMIQAFLELHRRGYAHSVEIYDGDELVGGLYGLYINGVFIGESMFSRVPSGSKVALIALCQHLRRIGGRLVDCQNPTPHLRSMGGRSIPYDDYLNFFEESDA